MIVMCISLWHELACLHETGMYKHCKEQYRRLTDLCCWNGGTLVLWVAKLVLAHKRILLGKSQDVELQWQ